MRTNQTERDKELVYSICTERAPRHEWIGMAKIVVLYGLGVWLYLHSFVAGPDDRRSMVLLGLVFLTLGNMSHDRRRYRSAIRYLIGLAGKEAIKAPAFRHTISTQAVEAILITAMALLWVAYFLLLGTGMR